MKSAFWKLIGFASIFLFNEQIIGQVTFSEVMFDVATNENHDEFIEIFNLSYHDSIDATGWHFSDSSGSDEIISYRGGLRIAPRSFAIILDGSYASNSNSYESVIPDSVVILTIDDNAFGSGGLSNSKNEYLSIYDGSGDTLASYRYSTGNKPGFSDEKIIMEGSNSNSNWQDSKFLGGTPGFRNSVTPPDWDLGFDQNSINVPYQIFENDSITVAVTLQNFGLQSIQDSIELICFVDRNDDLQLSENDILIEKKNLYIDKNFEQKDFQFSWFQVPAGEHLLVIHINYARDENRENDDVSLWVTVLALSPELHLNEIKFLTREGEPEWIELINSGKKKIYLKEWALADLVDTVMIDTPVFIWPDQLKIITTDTLSQIYPIADSLLVLLNNFIILNNNSDEITLLQPGGEEREKLIYDISWLEGEQGRLVSLEKINPHLFENKSENWGPSVATSGATPGLQNSIFSNLTKKEGHVHIAPNPFSPDADGFEDVAIISGELPETSARLKVQIFNIKGYHIRTLQDNRFTGSRFHLVWDGRDDQGHTARIGIYIIFIQALNDWQGVLHELKTTVVLAKKL